MQLGEQASLANASFSESALQENEIFIQLPTPADDEVARELSKMTKLIIETAATQDQKLEDIKRSTFAVESKLAEIANRLSQVENRLGFLEDANQRLQEARLASCNEVDTLRQKLDDIENRDR
ncbi:hypothetical protein LDENG_00196180 [Lucifuga dentata]|nr:hypothetical protein LDENG_00196180 [Lucifuga dentata]